MKDRSEMLDGECLHGFDEKEKLVVWKGIEDLFEERFDGEERG
jgi:hypothetical protein